MDTMALRVSRSQILISAEIIDINSSSAFKSAARDARCLPSGLKTTCQKKSTVCPSSVAISLPVSMFQTRILLSRQPAARSLPSGLRAPLTTSSVAPSSRRVSGVSVTASQSLISPGAGEGLFPSLRSPDADKPFAVWRPGHRRRKPDVGVHRAQVAVRQPAEIMPFKAAEVRLAGLGTMTVQPPSKATAGMWSNRLVEPPHAAWTASAF